MPRLTVTQAHHLLWSVNLSWKFPRQAAQLDPTAALRLRVVTPGSQTTPRCLRWQLTRSFSAKAKNINHPPGCTPGRPPGPLWPTGVDVASTEEILTAAMGKVHEKFILTIWYLITFSDEVFGRCCGGCGGYVGGKPAPEHYQDGLFGDPRMTTWTRGQPTEVYWASGARHRGGYAYRLCKVNDGRFWEVSEECFQAGHLNFYGKFIWSYWFSF